MMQSKYGFIKLQVKHMQHQVENSILEVKKVTSTMVSVPNSFLHWSILAHICFVFSMSNFRAFRNLHHELINALVHGYQDINMYNQPNIEIIAPPESTKNLKH